MKKVLKKLGMLALTLVILCGSAVGLAGCKEKDENQVMVLSMNPEVEFILDSKDKVVSVTAKNEDGVYLLKANVNFVGMSAEEAAIKFLEECEKHGFVVRGGFDNASQDLTISVSGEGDEDLYKSISKKTKNIREQLNVHVMNMVELDDDELEEMVALCYQEYSDEYIDSLNETQLINLLKQSREETKELVTEQERISYYVERAQTIIDAKIAAIQEYISSGANTNAGLTTAFGMINSIYNNILKPKFDDVYEFISDKFESIAGINADIEEYIAGKKEYLEAYEQYKQGVISKEQLASIKASADENKAALKLMQEGALESIRILVEQVVHPQLVLLNQHFDTIISYMNEAASSLQTKVNAEIAALKSEYASKKSDPWQ